MIQRFILGICIFYTIFLWACSSEENTVKTPLMKAVSTGNEARVKKLLRQGADILEVHPITHRTLLMMAVKYPDILEMLLEKDSSNINAQDDKGWTALIYAILISAPPESIEILLKYGANPNDILDKNGTSVLHFAANSGNEQIVNLLLNASADINIQDRDMQTPLMIAAGFKNKRVVQLLLLKGADINLSDKEGRTVVMRSPDIIPFINLSSVELNKTDNNGHTLLHWAAIWDNPRLVQKLIRAGLNPNISSPSGKAPLMSAAYNASNSAIKFLIQSGADIHQQDNEGATALLYAVIGHKDSPETVNLLLKNHSDINHADNHGQTALMLASERGFEKSVKLLLGKGANLNLQDNLQGTALMHALIFKQYHIAQLLFQSGDNVQSNFPYNQLLAIVNISQNKHRHMGLAIKQDEQWGIAKNAIFLAIVENDLETLNKLISSGIDVNLAGKDGITPLMFASIHAQTPIVSALLKADANVDAQSEQGDSALILAATFGQKNNVQELLKFHANVNLKNKEGQTALFRASNLLWHENWQKADLQAHIDILNLLLKGGAEVEVYDRNNESPLLLASSLVGHHQLVALLLEAGANPAHSNNEGKNAWDYANELKEQFNDSLTLEVLKRHQYKF